jgi:hypothetical protein
MNCCAETAKGSLSANLGSPANNINDVKTMTDTKWLFCEWVCLFIVVSPFE